MATVTVFWFPAAEGADRFLTRVVALKKRHLLKLHDAAIVSWPKGEKRPRTRQLVSLVGAGALGGLFWGALFGFIFAAPLFGLAAGAVAGALTGAFRDYGIDDDFIELVRRQLVRGSSALFVLTSGAVLDRVGEELRDEEFEILTTNLSRDDEKRLRQVFGRDG